MKTKSTIVSVSTMSLHATFHFSSDFARRPKDGISKTSHWRMLVLKLVKMQKIYMQCLQKLKRHPGRGL